VRDGNGGVRQLDQGGAGDHVLRSPRARRPRCLIRFDDLLACWNPLTEALNELNRSMGLPDLYPFVLSAPAVDKLRFVHDVVSKRRST